MDPTSNLPLEATAATQSTSTTVTPYARGAPSEPELTSAPELTDPTRTTFTSEDVDTNKPLLIAESTSNGPPPEPTSTGQVSAVPGDRSTPSVTEPEALSTFGPADATEMTLAPEPTVPGESSMPFTSAAEPARTPPFNPPRSSLFSLPPDLPAMRARFFSLDTPLVLSQAQFQEYWPFVDNMYVKNKERPVTLDNTRSAYYYCRLWKKSDYIGVSPAIRQRKKHCRATIACPMKFKAVFHGDSHVKIERLNDGAHNHDLDYVDSIKRNSAVRNIAAVEVSKGYKPCDVARNLRESARADNLRALQAAGGAYICLKDVHNAGRLKPANSQSPS